MRLETHFEKRFKIDMAEDEVDDEGVDAVDGKVQGEEGEEKEEVKKYYLHLLHPRPNNIMRNTSNYVDKKKGHLYRSVMDNENLVTRQMCT